jgi:hypothetical protein
MIMLLIMQEDFVFANQKTVTDVKKAKIVPVLIIIPIILFGVWRVTHRSGVSHKDIRHPLPGDDLVPDANW